MSEGAAALLGALIGALAGLAGGALAALASLRASQVTARAPLGGFLHELSVLLVKARAAVGQPDEDRAVADMEQKWNQFAVHQRIICPSDQIEELTNTLRSELKRADISLDARLHLSGQVLEKLSRMVGAHSSHMLRCSASRTERRIVSQWLDSEQSNLLGGEARSRLRSRSGCRPTRRCS